MSRDFHALCRACATFVLLVVALATAAGTARADGAGSQVLTRAGAAWDQGDFDVAESLYKESLDRGALSPAETLDAYVHLGAARVVLGHEKDALVAFRLAALLDPHFSVPKEAGRKAARVANQAKRESQRFGPYVLKAEAPETSAANQPFRVSAGMDATHAALITKIRVIAKVAPDKTFEKAEPPATSVSFDIPAALAVGDQTVIVRIDALDTHDNRVVSAEKRVRIGPGPTPTVTPPTPTVTPPTPTVTPPTPTVTPPTPPTPPPTEKPEDKDKEKKGDEESDGEGPWSIPHGSKKYTAIRADKAPKIDGVLNDQVWAKAPRDNRFLSTRSKPFGNATTEPTVVQVAYDEENLYVAFRCTYSKAGGKDDSFAGDEQTLLTESESVGVIVDPVHGHTGAYEFLVSPIGARGDLELSEQGSVENLDWRGIWEVDTTYSPEGWVAEFRIPWGTMRMPAHPESFDLGINFSRREPTSGEYSVWALHPPATEIFDTNFFGHLDGLKNVFPGQRLYIEPYVAFGFDRTPPPQQSALTDLTGNGQFRPYVGGYARLRPPGPFRMDATFNPDFSAVNPDQALANFDRFELEFPEARPFFAEDTPRFAFGAPRYLYGDLGAQLFYSRRLGIVTNIAGLTQAVPILWGVKSVLREGGTEAAVMNVETSPAHRTVSLLDNATVGRVTETYEGQRIGAIFLNRAGDSGAYTAGGADAAIALYERHLQFSGFYAASQSQGLPVSGAGEGTIAWRSQDYYAQATYLDIGKNFDAPLGFFPITGARAEMIAAGYTPVVRNDLVQQVFLDSQLELVRDRVTDERIFDRGVLSASLATIQQAVVQVAVFPAIENVVAPFPIGNGRITVPVGTYKVMVTQVDVTTAPRRTVVFGVGYQGGDLYDGQRKAPSATLGLNLGRFSSKMTYQIFILSYGDERFVGHRVSTSASYAYTSLAKTTLLVEANTVAARAVAQLATSVQFGTLSTLSLALRGTSGSTVDTAAQDWYDNPDFTAILSLAIGITPF